MKRFRYKALIFTLGMLLLAGTAASAGEFSKVGSVGAQFLKIGMGARYIGLGEASAAIADDAYAMYWNPAGMALMEETEFAFTNVDWVEDIRLNYVSFAKPMGFGGTVGFSMTMLNVGDMEETTVYEPEGTGYMFDASSYSIAAGYGRSLTDRFALGFKIKYVSEKISEVTSKGFAVDFGTYYETGFRNLRMGLNIANIGPSMKFTGSDLNFSYLRDQDNTNYDPVNASLTTEEYDLPLTFRFGIAYDLYQTSMSNWMIAVEGKHPNDNVQQASLGSEYVWNETVSLRAGYKFRYEEEGVSLGAGLVLNPTNSTALVVDYAWSDFGRLESVHRFSFGLKF